MEELKVVGYGILIIVIVIFITTVILSIVLKIGIRLRKLLFQLKKDD